MQISSEQVSRLRDAARKSEPTSEAPVESVQDLAARYGLSMDQVRRHAQSAMMAEEDPARERRVMELARRVAEGSYSVSSEDLLDMAERRAVADRAGQI